MKLSRFPRWLLLSAATILLSAAFMSMKARTQSPDLLVVSAARKSGSAEHSRFERSEADPGAFRAPPSLGMDGDRSDTEAQVMALRRELVELSRRLEASEQPGGERLSEEPTDAADEARAERERSQHLFAGLNDAFLREANDPGWSAAAVQEVSRSLMDPALESTQLGEIRCQSSLCRIEASHGTRAAEQNFIMHLGRLDAFRDGEAFFRRIERDDGSIATIVFLSRAGHSLPGPEDEQESRS